MNGGAALSDYKSDALPTELRQQRKCILSFEGTIDPEQWNRSWKSASVGSPSAGNRVGPDRTEPVSWDVAPWPNFISSDPNVCDGELYPAPTFQQQIVLDSLAEASTREEILRGYPSLRPEHVDAALSYATELAHQERLGTSVTIINL
jgi:uncharacterized protein (DUF433 family)